MPNQRSDQEDMDNFANDPREREKERNAALEEALDMQAFYAWSPRISAKDAESLMDTWLAACSHKNKELSAARKRVEQLEEVLVECHKVIRKASPTSSIRVTNDELLHAFHAASAVLGYIKPAKVSALESQLKKAPSIVPESWGAVQSHEEAAEKPCCHEWYQGYCCHCEISAKDFRAGKTIAQLEARIKELETKRDAAFGELLNQRNQLNAQLATLRAENANPKNEVAQTHREYDAMKGMLTAENANLNAGITGMKLRLGEVIAENAKLKEENKDLRSYIAHEESLELARLKGDK